MAEEWQRRSPLACKSSSRNEQLLPEDIVVLVNYSQLLLSVLIIFLNSTETRIVLKGR
jgi:hypothetical protein